MQVRAVEHIRPMRGGAQAQMIRAEDGNFYVVKFSNNPQHRRVLANEWIAASLAELIGLPVPPVAQIEVPQQLIDASPGLVLRIAGAPVPCEAGVQFGSRLPSPDPHQPIFDYLPPPALARVANIIEFVGILLFDKWTCNCDARQVIFCRAPVSQNLRAYMVDQGFCFNAGEWNFPDSPLRGVYSHNLVYTTISGWNSFEPWLSRIEGLSEEAIMSAGREVPNDWHGDEERLRELLFQLTTRRGRLRELLWQVKKSPRDPFGRWVENGYRAKAA